MGIGFFAGLFTILSLGALLVICIRYERELIVLENEIINYLHVRKQYKRKVRRQQREAELAKEEKIRENRAKMRADQMRYSTDGDFFPAEAAV